MLAQAALARPHVMGWLLLIQLRRGISIDSLATLVEQIEHEPLEI